MEYNLEQIALIVEIIGGLAVIISPVFVGLQLKESAKATRSQIAAATVSEMTSWYSNIGNSEQGSAVFWNFMTNPNSQTPEERFQAIMNGHGAMLTWQNSYYLVKEGTLDKRIHDSLVEIITSVKKILDFMCFGKLVNPYFLKNFKIMLNI